jgi:hypothetical protein
MGPEQGHKTTYGHQTVQFGKYADKEVYPLILDWLKRN